MWIVRLALRRPYTFVVTNHANGRFSLHQHSGSRRDLVLFGHESG